jgi:thymidine phosphorylase
MAVFFRGMTMAESMALTRAMTESGTVLDWRGDHLDRPVIDKHSTGGIGDKVSLMLAPIMAACGGFVPMISGRGLGHTGGTLDKLDSIPGYATKPSLEKFRRVVRDIGCAIAGATADLAPADARLYAIRDVTATVESIPLITASILSKKLAAGLQALVMDVKAGSGAFMARREDAQMLARSIVDVANGAGLRTAALITDMNQALGRAVGNAVEVAEAVDYLTGKARDPRLHAATMALAGELLNLGGLAGTAEDGRAKAETALAGGKPAEIFGRMVAALGGPADYLQAYERKYRLAAKVVKPFAAPRDGYIIAMECRDVGVAAIGLGGGRRKASDAIDLTVGFSGFLPVGARLQAGDSICLVHAGDEAKADAAIAALGAAIRIGDERPAPARVVSARITDHL